jgi:hypothetical protein
MISNRYPRLHRRGTPAKIRNKYLKKQQSLSETQQRLKEAEKLLAKEAAIKAGRMVFRYNVYWAKNADGSIEKTPYCPRCFDKSGDIIHLTVFWGEYIAGCPECNTTIIITGKPQ